MYDKEMLKKPIELQMQNIISLSLLVDYDLKHYNHSSFSYFDLLKYFKLKYQSTELNYQSFGNILKPTGIIIICDKDINKHFSKK
jgi:hypothetical protein